MIRKAQAQINQPLDKILNDTSMQNSVQGLQNQSESKEEISTEIIDKRIQHYIEKGLADVYKKIAGDDITGSLTQVNALNHLGSNSKAAKDIAPLYLDRVKEILRDELVREKEVYITKLHSQLQQNTHKRKEVLSQIERVEGEYGEVAK